MDLLREGALNAVAGRWAEARDAYSRAAEALPKPGPAHLRQALLALDRGDADEARRRYSMATAADPSLRTPYNNAGPIYANAGKHREAGREYRRALLLDPADSFAWAGLGTLACRKRKWAEGEALFAKALELEPGLPEALRGLARVRVQQSRTDEAIALYERALHAVMRGGRTVSDVIASGPGRLLDPNHAAVHARLARLYAGKGDVRRAIAGFRMSLGLGLGGPAVHWRFAALYARERDWRRCFGELLSAARAAARVITGLCTRIWSDTAVFVRELSWPKPAQGRGAIRPKANIRKSTRSTVTKGTFRH